MYQISQESIDLFKQKQYNQAISLFLFQNRCVFCGASRLNKKIEVQSYSRQRDSNNSPECRSMWDLRDKYVIENRDRSIEERESINFVETVNKMDNEIRARFSKQSQFRKKLENKHKTIWFYKYLKRNNLIGD